jgi:dihydroneopterin aldolase
MASDLLKISKMTFYAYHGLHNEEKLKGQQFEVDVIAKLDLTNAGHSDNLEDTIDVNLIYDLVEEIILEGDFNLLEAIAEHIAAALLDKLKIEEVQVCVRKPHAPIRGISAGIEVEITRHE